ncbi:MAG: energy transducer TonB [Terriglobales bacterium]
MAQTQVHVERKVISRVAPFYPETARRMRLAGVVKLEIIIRANGTVKSVKALGGSPVLIPSAAEAVQNWKFEAAPEETSEIVQIKFESP